MTQYNDSVSGMIKFLLGETKFIKFKATYPEYPEFEIADAKYEVYRNNRLVEEGAMDIDGHNVSMRYTPPERGFLDLYIQLTISDTVRRKHFRIDVD